VETNLLHPTEHPEAQRDRVFICSEAGSPNSSAREFRTRGPRSSLCRVIWHPADMFPESARWLAQCPRCTARSALAIGDSDTRQAPLGTLVCATWVTVRGNLAAGNGPNYPG